MVRGLAALPAPRLRGWGRTTCRPPRPGAAPVPPAEPARIGPAWRGRGAPCSASLPPAACSAPCQVPGAAARGAPGGVGTARGGPPRRGAQHRGQPSGQRRGAGASARWWGWGRRVWGALPEDGSLQGAAPRPGSPNSGEVPAAPGAVAPAGAQVWSPRDARECPGEPRAQGSGEAARPGLAHTRQLQALLPRRRSRAGFTAPAQWGTRGDARGAER